MDDSADLKQRIVSSRIRVRKSGEEMAQMLCNPDWRITNPGMQAAYDLSVATEQLLSIVIDRGVEGLYSADGQRAIREAVRAYRANMQFVDKEETIDLDFEEDLGVLLDCLWE